MNPARLIIDPPAAGSWNMAVDRSLLQSANQLGQLTLRFYQWSRPTLSLGYFQKIADRAGHAASRDCDLVRRTSGGGAILHHHDLTYSICLPADHPVAKRNTDLYSLVHEGLIQSLAKFGITAQQAASNDASAVKSKTFLCFQRITDGDLLIANSKIGGSAQRRDRNALLQHGSLLLKRSEFAPELPGIAEQVGTSPKINDLILECSKRIGRGLSASLEEAKLTDSERLAAEEIHVSQFTTDQWNRRR